MNKAHTPAPWRLNGCELIADSTVIATIHWHTGRDAENTADGALMESAPNTLRALVELEAYLRDTPHHNAPEAAAARAAIRAATGAA